MNAETATITVHEAMARFRSSLLRRASAVAWVVLIVIGAQAVRSPTEDGTQLFTLPDFYIPMAGMATLLVASTAIRWDRVMATVAAPWIATFWLMSLIAGITALATIPDLNATTEPILFGIAAVSGLLLAWWVHVWITLIIALAMSFIAITLGEANVIADLVAPAVVIMVVAAATALVGIEFEK